MTICGITLQHSTSSIVTQGGSIVLYIYDINSVQDDTDKSWSGSHWIWCLARVSQKRTQPLLRVVKLYLQPCNIKSNSTDDWVERMFSISIIVHMISGGDCILQIGGHSSYLNWFTLLKQRNTWNETCKREVSFKRQGSIWRFVSQ